MEIYRLRRMRKNHYMRDLVSETQLSVENLLQPFFVYKGKKKKEAIEKFPGVYRYSPEQLVAEAGKSVAAGIRGILLFAVLPESEKDEMGTQSWAYHGLMQQAVRLLKKTYVDLLVFTDVCLCGYTRHGHCGIINQRMPDNDKTIELLAKISLSHAEAGADFVAPSAMMDGQVAVIRKVLDKHGFSETGILAYSAKYASSFYGPFRQALESKPQFGDRKSYQLDYRNAKESLREVEQDIREGADIVMIKPALAYLDIISRVKAQVNVPVAAYNVSGEYALLKAGARAGIAGEKEMVMEVLTAIKRAGADIIISYYAKDVAGWLREKK